jgi:plastocyanin
MFPGTLKVHQGDIVEAAWRGADTPHTGTFVPSSDPEAWRQQNQGPGGPYEVVVPDSRVGGDDNELDLNPSVANPTDPSCGDSQGPCTFDGSSVANDGFAFPSPGNQPKVFTQVTAPVGTYSFLCLLHPGMETLLRVVPGAEDIPSPKDVRERARQQIAHARAVDGPVADSRAQQVTTDNLGGGHVRWTLSAGGFFHNASANEFPDAGLRVRPGDQIRIKANFELHTATTPLSSASKVPLIIPECEVAGPDTPPPCGDPSKFRLAFNNRAINPTPNHGLSDPNAFRNSGLLSVPPGGSFTFVARNPGEYTLVCLVHGPEMLMTVTVEG